MGNNHQYYFWLFESVCQLQQRKHQRLRAKHPLRSLNALLPQKLQQSPYLNWWKRMWSLRLLLFLKPKRVCLKLSSLTRTTRWVMFHQLEFSISRIANGSICWSVSDFRSLVHVYFVWINIGRQLKKWFIWESTDFQFLRINIFPHFVRCMHFILSFVVFIFEPRRWKTSFTVLSRVTNKFCQTKQYKLKQYPFFMELKSL